jgi:hypothetical protein
MGHEHAGILPSDPAESERLDAVKEAEGDAVLKRLREWLDGFSGVTDRAVTDTGAKEKDPKVTRTVKALALASLLAVSPHAKGQSIENNGVDTSSQGALVGQLLMDGVAGHAGPVGLLVTEALGTAMELQNNRDIERSVAGFTRILQSSSGGELLDESDGVRGVFGVRPATGEETTLIKKQQGEYREGSGNDQMEQAMTEAVAKNPMMRMMAMVGELDPATRIHNFVRGKVKISPELEAEHSTIVQALQDGYYVADDGKVWIITLTQKLPEKGEVSYQAIMSSER